MDKYFLHINEPCTQNWESMTTAERGKFCNQCNKTVFDFTTATDAGIVKHIEAMKGEPFCGRFEENQMDRYIERKDIKTINPRLYKFLIIFILLGVVQGANAQTTTAQESVVIKRKLDSLVNLDYPRAASSVYVYDTTKKNQTVPNWVVAIDNGKYVSSNNKVEPLIIVNGITIKQQTLKKLNPDKIVALKVLNSNEARDIYGPKAANGVILLTSTYTKKELRRYNK